MTDSFVVHQSCGECAKNYTGECKPSDVGKCLKNGRPSKFKPGSPEFCECGGELRVRRTNKNYKAMEHYIPRTRECSVCHRKYQTGEFILN
jgi:hypothetical protein